MLKSLKLAAVMGMVALLTSASVEAAEVVVSGVHLCCGACVRDVGKALKDVEGIQGSACDRAAKTVTFQADNLEAAAAAIKALADGGFHGTAKMGDEEIAFPASGAKDGDKADSIVLAGVHLCCGSCATGVQKALKVVDGATVEVDRGAKTVTVTGSGLDVVAVVAALNAGGFHGTLSK